MHLENIFTVDAAADLVYEFLLDVNSVLGCVPGAELSEIVDGDTFRGRVRLRLGQAGVVYEGTGHVVRRDTPARTAVIEVEGRELGGAGAARAVVEVSVGESGEGAEVAVVTDLSVGGDAEPDAELGDQVATGLLTQLGACIGARLRDPVLPTPILSAEPPPPPTPVERALSIARDRPVALASAGGAAAALVVVAVLLRVRGRRPL